MKEPRISVIVPVYNAEKYLKKCVASLLDQTIPLQEIILVDDGSTDGSAYIADELADSSECVHVLHLPNRGVSSARNTGIEVAQGDFIAFIDADDWAENDLYETLYLAMKSTNADVAVCDYIFYDDSTGTFMQAGLYHEQKYLESIPAIQCLTSTSCVAWNKLFKRSVLQGKLFPTDIRIGEDTLFLIEVFRDCKGVVFVPQGKIYYRQHIGSAMKSDYSEKVWDNLISGQRVYTLMNEISEQLRPAAAYRLTENLLNIIYKLSYVPVWILWRKRKEIREIQVLLCRNCTGCEKIRPMTGPKKKAVTLFKGSPVLFFVWIKSRHLVKSILLSGVGYRGEANEKGK